MKYSLLLAAILFSTLLNAQLSSGKPASADLKTNMLPLDTAFKVICADKSQSRPSPAFFINGRLVKSLTVTNISAFNIENVNVVPGDTLVDKVLYNGKLYIETKAGQHPKLISLTELKNKYTDFKDQAVIFTLDGNLVDDNYDNYLVDESSLLTIIVDKSKMKLGTTQPGLIRLLTKSEANIKARNQIMIRGAELTTSR